MKKFTLALFLLTGVSSTVIAQSKFNVVGTIIEKENHSAIPQATVRVLSLPDSAMVTGASTDANGSFKIQNVKKGKYALKVSFIGYQDHTINLDLTNKNEKTVNIGYLTLLENNKMLKEAVVSANAAQVQVSGDSLVYNASAFRVAEGSALEELVKKLPGAEIDDDGNIKINGKTVKKIMVDGKEFFLNDTKVALKNIPTNIIDRLKTYDKKSDLAQMTGIDDGDDETVLDIQVKKGMNNGWTGNIDAGIGTDHRYSERFFVMHFADKTKIAMFGNINNTGDRGFGGGGGRGGWGRANNGLNSSKAGGIQISNESDKLSINGNARIRYDGADAHQEQNSHTWIEKEDSTTGQKTIDDTYRNSTSHRYTSNISANTSFRIEWKPDTMTTILFRPSGSLSRNRGITYDDNSTYNFDPEKITGAASDPIKWAQANVKAAADDNMPELEYILNSGSSYQQTYSTNKSLNGELQINRRLNNDGRNITLRTTGGLSDQQNKQLSASDVTYRKETAQTKSTYNNRYYLTPSKSHNYSAQLTYSEPIAYKTYLQFSYKFDYQYNMSDRDAKTWSNTRAMYDIVREALSTHRYNVAGALDQLLQDPIANSNTGTHYTDSISNRLSQYSEYRTYTHTTSISFRKVGDTYNLSAGIDLIPQHTSLDYKYMGNTYLKSRNVFNFAPSLNYQYRPNQTTTLRATYNGRTSQPSMTAMLDITDDSNPNNITIGNPNLKPSFNHSLNLFYSTYNAELQQGIFTFANANMTQNSISTRLLSIENGKRTTTTDNINGNWNANAGFGYNRGLGEKKYFNMNTFSRMGFNHKVSYAGISRATTKETTLGQRLSFGYRRDWFEFSINGNVNYDYAANSNSNNLNTWDFSYGCEMNLNFNCGFSLSTDISENSRRGYSSSSMNTNELVWNAQISQSFLKNNSLVITLQWNDILTQRSKISRTIAAYEMTDVRYNSIYSYGMLHVIYKLNIFGGKNANGNNGAPFGGGFGGGRPGGFGGGQPNRRP